MSDRQSSLDQTLTSVISLLENEQTLKKVRVSCILKGESEKGWEEGSEEGREEGKKQESISGTEETRTNDRQSKKHLNLLMILLGELLGN
jgi:hypothetical protein